jgi:hypothetical protein
VRPLPTDRDGYSSNGHLLELQDDRVLPSIEGPQGVGTFSQTRRVNGHGLFSSIAQVNVPKPTHRTGQLTTDQVEFLDMTEEDPPLRKRRRLEEHERESLRSIRTDPVPYPSIRPREVEYISLLSPTEGYSQPLNSAPSIPSSNPGRAGPKNLSSYTPSSRDTQGVDSLRNSQAGQGMVTRPLGPPVQTLHHTRSHEPLYPYESTSKLDKEPVSFRHSLSALPGRVIAEDPAIQEYRAFRARESQNNAAQTPSRGRYSHQDSSSRADIVRPARNVQLRQLDGAESSPVPYTSRLNGHEASREYVALDDSYPIVLRDEHSLRHERLLDRRLVPLRRSASPVTMPRQSLSYASETSERHRVVGRGIVGQTLSNRDHTKFRDRGYDPISLPSSGRYESECEPSSVITEV